MPFGLQARSHGTAPCSIPERLADLNEALREKVEGPELRDWGELEVKKGLRRSFRRPRNKDTCR
jgi:hypothetical protein